MTAAKRALVARSVSEFVEIVRDVRANWTSRGLFFDPWFRGQSAFRWPLRPSLYRQDMDPEEEEEIRAEFIRRGIQLLTEREPRTEWEWYFLMQHYGAPTRLLDWTDSALVALFFAVNSNPPTQTKVTADACVWALDPWWLNSQVLDSKSIVLTDWPEAKPYLPKLFDGKVLRRRLPIAIDPPHVARRVSVQRSRFTIHGTDSRGLETVGKRRGARLLQIRIPRSKINEVRLDLSTCGVTDATLFPDLEGLSRELVRYAHGDW